MTYCNNCGAALGTGDLFCGKCGSRTAALAGEAFALPEREAVALKDEEAVSQQSAPETGGEAKEAIAEAPDAAETSAPSPASEASPFAASAATSDVSSPFARTIGNSCDVQPVSGAQAETAGEAPAADAASHGALPASKASPFAASGQAAALQGKMDAPAERTEAAFGGASGAAAFNAPAGTDGGWECAACGAISPAENEKCIRCATPRSGAYTPPIMTAAAPAKPAKLRNWLIVGGIVLLVAIFVGGLVLLINRLVSGGAPGAQDTPFVSGESENPGEYEEFFARLEGYWVCEGYEDWYLCFYSDGSFKFVEEGWFDDNFYLSKIIQSFEKHEDGYRFAIQYADEDGVPYEDSEPEVWILSLEGETLFVTFSAEDDDEFTVEFRLASAEGDYYEANPYYNGVYGTDGGGSASEEAEGFSDFDVYFPENLADLGRCEISGEGSALYTGPGYDYEQMKELEAGASGEAWAETDGWIYVFWDGGDIGWVERETLVFLEEAETAAAEELSFI
ncbi:MAG: hypothetical protein Q4B42_04040 [Oscillospiraceae bacterium]|nr:hypothetical protein [Oscillospiraceae bacterium]